MSDEILSLIYTFSKKFSDPETNLSFDPKNQNISVVIKDGNVNISLLVKGQKEDLYLNIARLLKNNVEQISGILFLLDDQAAFYEPFSKSHLLQKRYLMKKLN